MTTPASPITLLSGHRLSRSGSGWQAQTPTGETQSSPHARILLRTLAQDRATAAVYGLAPERIEAVRDALADDLRRRYEHGFVWRVVASGDGFLVLDELDDALRSYRVWAQPGGPQPYVTDRRAAGYLTRRPPSPEAALQGERALRFVAACHNMTLGLPLPAEIDPARVPERPWYVTEIERHDVVHAADGTALFSWTHPNGVDAHDRHVAEDCVVLANAYPPTTERLVQARAAMKQRRRALRRLELS